MEFVLFGIHTKALGDEINLNSIDVFDKTRNRRHELLHDVPVYVGDESATTLHYLIETVGSLFKREF